MNPGIDIQGHCKGCGQYTSTTGCPRCVQRTSIIPQFVVPVSEPIPNGPPLVDTAPAWFGPLFGFEDQ
jgi:hypothetical protein